MFGIQINVTYNITRDYQLYAQFCCWICPGAKTYGASSCKLKRKNKDGSVITGLEGLVAQSFCRHLRIRRSKKSSTNVLGSKLHGEALAFLHKLQKEKPRMYQDLQLECMGRAAEINKGDLGLEVDLRLFLPLLTDAEVLCLVNAKVSVEVQKLVVSLGIIYHLGCIY